MLFRSVCTFAAFAILSAKLTGAAAPPSPAVPPEVQIEREVPYLAAGRTETLDLYLPLQRVAGVLKRPAVVIIHGGGWSGGSKSATREFEIGTTLAKAGYVCASVAYRLDAHDRWPTNLFDCKNAVRFLRANAAKYGVDTEHIGVIGGSAGGHLALMVGFTDRVKELEPPAASTLYPNVSDRVQAVVDMYGIADVRTRKKIAPDGTPGAPTGPSVAVFGDHQPITDADLALASPVTHLSSDIPPVLILHGTADTTVDRDQSLDLDRRLQDLHLPHRLILVPGVGHTFDLETWNRKPLPMDLRPTVLAFFDHALKPPAGNAPK